MDGTVIDANGVFMRSTGYARADIESGKLSWRAITPPEYVEESERQHEKLLKTGILGPYEKEYFHSDGTRSWMRFSGQSLGDGTWVKFCFDITDRKRFEKALGESEERLRLAQQAGHVGVFDWNLVTNEATWTPELEYIFGLEPGRFEKRYKGWSRRVHPEDLSRLEALFADWFQSNREEEQWEYRFLRHGEIRWVLAHGRILRDQAGKPMRMVGTNLDITERKRTELALRESEERLQLALHAADMDAVIWYPEQDTCELDARALDICGLKPADQPAFRKFMETIVDEDDREPLRRAFERLRNPANAGELREDIRITRPDGVKRWLMLLARGYSGGVPQTAERIVCGVIDITERKEEAFRVREERLRLALEAAEAGAWEAIPGKPELEVSERARILFGLPKESAINLDQLFASLHPDDQPRLESGLSHTIETGERLHLDVRLFTLDKGVRWLSVHAELHSESGRPRIVGLVQDITERAQASEHIRTLLAEVNHRAKNMLAVVQAVARQTVASEPGDFLERFSERIQALAANQDLLVKSEWKGVDLGDLIRSQLAHLNDLIGSRITLEGQPLLVSAQAAQALGLALHELATNATKYGALANATGRVGIAWMTGGSSPEAVFEMSWLESGGPPIAEPQRRGFGMTVISDLTAASLGGEVSLDFQASGLVWKFRCRMSDLGGGTSQGVIPAYPKTSGQIAPLKKPRILIVEDEPLIGFDLMRILKGADFEPVGPARSVVEGLDLLGEGNFSAAVLDIALGTETSAPIAQELRHRQIPFVTLSGYGQPPDASAYANAPALFKPVRAQTLISELRRCISASPLTGAAAIAGAGSAHSAE
jgi:PAS domain S-box-containing protein